MSRIFLFDHRISLRERLSLGGDLVGEDVLVDGFDQPLSFVDRAC
jgi:hypothetical protein